MLRAPPRSPSEPEPRGQCEAFGKPRARVPGADYSQTAAVAASLREQLAAANEALEKLKAETFGGEGGTAAKFGEFGEFNIEIFHKLS